MSIIDLEKDACLYWPSDLARQAAEVSTIGPLIETQDIFIAFLVFADASPTAWKDVLQYNKKLSPNLFLKHLMVLSDIGGERLQRFSKDFEIIFPDKKFEFIWENKEFEYVFKSGGSFWSNKNISVEKSVLLDAKSDFSPQMEDVCMLLLWGGLIKNSEYIPVEITDKCILGNMLGKKDELTNFIKQRYIIVSRQTGGSTANDLGHICEEYIKLKLSKLLPSSVMIGGHNIPGVTHNEKNLSTFDLVAKGRNGKYIGIEISFQVTTNSTIERKAGLAKSRRDLVHKQGHKIAYIVDGSGNFQRRNAITTIIESSDCTVNFSDEGLNNLATFIINSCK